MKTRLPRGFSLLEALIATALVATAVVAFAHLTVVAAAQASRTTHAEAAMTAAQAKIEQLRSLPWTYAADGTRHSDAVGLRLSPADSLRADYAGFVDEVGAPGDGSADYTRRWAISPLNVGDLDTLLLQVCVLRPGLPDRRAEVCLWSIRTRTR